MPYAPELHYKAAPLKTSTSVTDAMRAKYNSLNKDRRQYFAESATVALYNFLKPYANSKGIVKATFYSYVDKPFEVVDTYGRFIGNIQLTDKKDINLWLVQNGWVIPTFYTSMLVEEIETFLKAWKKAARTSGNISADAKTTPPPSSLDGE